MLCWAAHVAQGSAVTLMWTKAILLQMLPSIKCRSVLTGHVYGIIDREKAPVSGQQLSTSVLV